MLRRYNQHVVESRRASMRIPTYILRRGWTFELYQSHIPKGEVCTFEAAFFLSRERALLLIFPVHSSESPGTQHDAQWLDSYRLISFI